MKKVKGKKYIIVDDDVTSCCKVVSSKEYIEHNGGIVESVVSLANTCNAIMGWRGHVISIIT
jgi:hypothetical protein